MFGRLGFWELAVIVILALIIFGPKKLPEIGKALGRGIREFRDATTKMADELNSLDEPVRESQAKKESAPGAAAAAAAAPGGSTAAPAAEAEETAGAPAVTESRATTSDES